MLTMSSSLRRYFQDQSLGFPWPGQSCKPGRRSPPASRSAKGYAKTTRQASLGLAMGSLVSRLRMSYLALFPELPHSRPASGRATITNRARRSSRTIRSESLWTGELTLLVAEKEKEDVPLVIGLAGSPPRECPVREG